MCVRPPVDLWKQLIRVPVSLCALSSPFFFLEFFFFGECIIVGVQRTLLVRGLCLFMRFYLVFALPLCCLIDRFDLGVRGVMFYVGARCVGVVFLFCLLNR
ncbi:unnamed protein product [Ectocarpus sp. 13 AM-2016]